MNARIIIIASVILGLSYIIAPIALFQVQKSFCEGAVSEGYVTSCLTAFSSGK